MSKDKNHINHLTPEVIEKYLQDKLTESQRHEVEMLMLNSDFDAEAMEGFESINTDEANSDLNQLNSRLNQRVKSTKKPIPIYWRIAAAVSLLAISGFMVFQLLKDSAPETQISQVKTPEEIITLDGLREEQEAAEAIQIDPSQIKMQESPKTTPSATIPDEKEGISEEAIVEADKATAKEISEDLDIEVRKIQDQIAARSQAAPARIEMPEKALTGKVTAADDNSPLAGVNVVVKGTTAGTVTDIDGNFKLTIPQGADSMLVTSFIGLESQTLDVSGKEEVTVEMYPKVQELSEVVVTRARSEKKALGLVQPEEAATTLPAKALVEDYDKYLEENLQYPEGENKRGNVVISFFVNADSTLIDFTVEKSLGEAFDKEAMRLIKEGPKWIPALENGQPVRQKVEVEVKFRRP